VFSYEIYHRVHLKSHHEMTNTEVYDYLTWYGVIYVPRSKVVASKRCGSLH